MRTLATLLLALVSVAAKAQTIPAPASSVYSGAQSVIAITLVDLSGFATKVEVTNVSNVANSALSTANSAYSYGYDAYMNLGYGKPWTQWFLGATRGVFSGPASMLDYWVHIDGSGAVLVMGHATGFQWTYMGRPTSGESVRWWSPCLRSPCLTEQVEVYPVNADVNGRPGDFVVRILPNGNGSEFSGPATDQ